MGSDGCRAGWLLEVVVCARRARIALAVALGALAVVAVLVARVAMAEPSASPTVFGSAVWGLGALLFLATSSSLVADDLRDGTAAFWVQKRRTGLRFFLRRLWVRLGVFTLAQVVILATLALALLTSAPGQVDAWLRLNAIVVTALLPLFGPTFALSCARVRYDAALALAIALLVSPPLLALSETSDEMTRALLRIPLHPWPQLDALSGWISAGGDFPSAACAWIVVQFVGWIAIGGVTLTHALGQSAGGSRGA